MASPSAATPMAPLSAPPPSLSLPTALLLSLVSTASPMASPSAALPMAPRFQRCHSQWRSLPTEKSSATNIRSKVRWFQGKLLGQTILDTTQPLPGSTSLPVARTHATARASAVAKQPGGGQSRRLWISLPSKGGSPCHSYASDASLRDVQTEHQGSHSRPEGLRRKLAAVYSRPALPALGSNGESGADACCLQVGERALAGCTQQALTKLKNVLPNDLGTEKVNSVSDKSSRSGALPL